MTTTEKSASRGSDATTEGLSPAERIRFQGFMEQVRSHEKALGVDSRERTSSKQAAKTTAR